MSENEDKLVGTNDEETGVYKQRSRWSAQQMALLQRAIVEDMSDEQCAALTGRTLKSVRQKRLRMDLIKKGGRPTDASHAKHTGKSREQITQERSDMCKKFWKARLERMENRPSDDE